MVIGWVHLVTFILCQVLYTYDCKIKMCFLALWALEFAANLVVFRKFAGRRWHRNSPLAGIIARIWATFLILSFNLASLNTLQGWSLDWFKLAWTSLSTFGFAATAYLVNVWFFAPAVLMYFTGLTMVNHPQWQYLIYGLSWWLTFETIGFTLERRRIRLWSHEKRLETTQAPVHEKVLA